VQVIELDIFGNPAPQGSKKIMRGRLIEASGEKLKVWRKSIARACTEYQSENILLGPIAVEVSFYLPRPPSVKQTKRPFPIVPPDLDKLCRGLLDGIGQSEAIWGDDSQVVGIKAFKYYADHREPGAEVRITAL
jgi:crossover junction endodeoxyribonuclease RusA